MTVIASVYRSNILRKPCTLAAMFIAAWSSFARADTIRVAQEHTDTEPFQLVITILEQTIARYGDGASLEWIDTTSMNQPRALRMLESCDADFDVYFSGFDIEREQRLLQVDFPLTMGLLGVRGFVTTQDRVETLQEDVENTRNWLIGSGRGWPDTRIMLDNGYQVTQANYENLWAMLHIGRFDVFQRGIQEAQLELRQRGNNLQLLDNVLMLYPLSTLLYVNPCKPELKAQLESMLQSAFADGLVQSIIYEDPFVALAIDRLTDETVHKIVLENTGVSDNFRAMVARYWLPEIQMFLNPSLSFQPQ